MKAILFAGLALVTSFATAFAKDPIVLFKALGEPVSGYAQILKALKSGDVIQFSDGATFEIKRVLETSQLGYSTFFVAISGGYLIRLPRDVGTKIRIDHGEEITYRRLLEDYLKFEPVLKAAGVPIAEIDWDRSLPGERVVVRELQIIGTLDDLRRFGHLLHPELRDKYLRQAQEWFESTWQIAKIGDLTLDQIALTPSGAVLLDWSWRVVRANSLEDGTVFTYSKQYRQMRALQVADRSFNLFDVIPDVAQLAPDNPYFEEAILIEINRRRRAAGWPKKTNYCEYQLGS